MLKKSDPELIKQFVSRRELLFLSCLPVTPNCHRVVEIGYGLSDGRLTFVSSMPFFYKYVMLSIHHFQFIQDFFFEPKTARETPAVDHPFEISTLIFF